METSFVNPQDGFLLAKDPRLLWIPLTEGQVCGVLAHGWRMNGGRIDFFVDVQDSVGVDGVMKTVSIPISLCAGEAVLQQSLRCREDVLRSPIGSKVLAYAPEYWDVVAGDGSVMQVLTMGYCLEGPHVVYSIIIKGWPQGSRPVLIDCLRFPLVLMPNDTEDWVTRVW